MKFGHLLSLTVLLLTSLCTFAQVSPREVNGARNTAAQGTRMDTNVSFSLRMSLAGEESLRNSATLGDNISIRATIRPEAEDIGKLADIILVDFLPPRLSMRNADGNFVSWNGSLRRLVPYLESVVLEDELDVEVFSGQLGATGNHRIFIGFLVDEALYFTPTALRFDIEEAPASPLELAQALFDSTVSPTIVQAKCIVCHVNNGEFPENLVTTSDPGHLEKNFDIFSQLHALRGSDFILNKTIGLLGHGGGVQLISGSAEYNSMEEFLGLLDQAGE